MNENIRRFFLLSEQEQKEAVEIYSRQQIIRSQYSTIAQEIKSFNNELVELQKKCKHPLRRKITNYISHCPDCGLTWEGGNA